MFIAAIAHIYSFPHYPFHINVPQYWESSNRNWFDAFLAMFDVSDVQEDVSEHFGVVSSSLSRRFRGRQAYQPVSRGGSCATTGSSYKSNNSGSASDSDHLLSPVPTTSHQGYQQRFEADTARLTVF
uniref:Uncharacterized protein n=1 Tax=Megaselia scalaris TaxID=36166 RepID=T1GJ10_MEGSC